MIVKSGKLCKISTGTNAKTYAYTRTQTSVTTATQGSAEIETTVTENSGNLITSGGVYTALSSFGSTIDLKETGETISNSQLVKLVNNKAYIINYSPNTPNVFQASSTTYHSICKIDTNKYLSCFKDVGNSGYGTAVVLTVNGTSISAGEPFVFKNSTTNNITIAQIDVDKAIATYTDSSNYGKSIVLSISGTTISAGTEYGFNISNVTYSPCVSKLDVNKAIVGYRNGSDSNYGTAVVLVVSGTAISRGTAFIFNTSNTAYTNIKIAQLDVNKVILCYRDGNATNYGKVIVLSVSGTTITAGTSVTFDANNNNPYMVISQLDTNKAVVIYTGTPLGSAKVLSISGTTITVGSGTDFENGSNWSSIALSTSKMLVVHTVSDAGTGCMLNISGTTITLNLTFAFNSGNTTGVTSLAEIDSDNAILVYTNSSNSSYGTSAVISKEKANGYVLSGQFNSNEVSGRSDNINVVPYVSLV